MPTSEEVAEENELEKTMEEMRENSRRLRDLTPFKEKCDTSASTQSKQLLLDTKVKVKREQSKRIFGLARKELTNEAIQGLFKIIYSPHVAIKLFWTFSIVVSLGLCSFLVVQTIMTYLNFGVNTTLRNVVENPTDFPKITICK
jgi:hypothetical protein